MTKNELTLDGSVMRALITEEEAEGYDLVKTEIIGEWRWGVVNQVIITDSLGNFWATTYRETTGDEYYTSLDDAGKVKLDRVVPVQVTTEVYKKVLDA